MGRRRVVGSFVKWTGTLLCLVIAAWFLFTLRREIFWNSSDSRYQVMFTPSAVAVHWPSPGGRLEKAGYRPPPGWSMWTTAAGEHMFLWWPVTESGAAWSVVAIPLWMPLATVGVPTGLLWYRNRRRTRAALTSMRVGVKDRLRPRCRQRVTLNLTILLMIAHLAVYTFAWEGSAWLCMFFGGSRWPPGGMAIGAAVSTCFVICFVFGAPAWGVFWAWLLVRYRNRLLLERPGVHCLECGYDLTGNVSGRCPECGTASAANAETSPE